MLPVLFARARIQSALHRAVRLVLMLLALASFGAAAQEVDETWAQLSDGGRFRVSVTSNLQPIAINQIHSWVLHVSNTDGESLAGAEITVTGGMPAHDHGLPTTPRMTQELGNGDYLIEGMRFHMNGSWEVAFTISVGSDIDTVIFQLEL